MKKLLAIAGISLRSTIRSRLVLVMLAILLAAIIGLPLTIKGDGTIYGEVQVLLTYTLGLVSLILSVVTVWAGCAAISQEISEKQIHLIVVKPVGRFHVWGGKWLGLVVLNGLLLAISVGVIYGLLAWTTRASRLTASERESLSSEILVARQRILPTLPDVEEEALALLHKQRAAGTVPPRLSASDALQGMRNILLTRRYSASNQESLEWIFDVVHVPPNRPLHLEFRFSSSKRSVGRIAGRWEIGESETRQTLAREVNSTPSAIHTLVLPPEVINDSGRLRVKYTNLNENPVRVLFAPDTGVGLYVYRGGFLGNLLRSVLILYFQIAFLAALGVTAGSLFSMPVASFVSLIAIVLPYSLDSTQTLATRNLLISAETEGRSPGPIGVLIEMLFKIMHFVISPLQTTNPLELIGVGQLVSWSSVGIVFLIKIAVYCSVMGIFGCWIFNRRELGRKG